MAAELMVNHSKASECHDDDLESFKVEMARMVNQVHRITLRLEQVNINFDFCMEIFS